MTTDNDNMTIGNDSATTSANDITIGSGETLMDKIRRIARRSEMEYYDNIYDVTFKYRIFHSISEFNVHMERVKEISTRNILLELNGKTVILSEDEKLLIGNLYYRTIEPQFTIEHWAELIMISADLCQRYSDAITVHNGVISRDRLREGAF